MDYNPFVILVFSDCICVIDAKLAVSRKCTDVNNQDNFFIHHEYDDYVDISKQSAFCKASFICDEIKSMTNWNRNRFLHDSILDVVSMIPRSTIVRFFIEPAKKHVTVKFGQKGHGHSKTELGDLLQMPIEEAIETTCKFLGLKLVVILTSISDQQFANKTIPFEIYGKMLLEAMKAHDISKCNASFDFKGNVLDEGFEFGKTIEMIGSRIHQLIKEKQHDIALTFMNIYCKTMEDLKNVSLTIENFKERFQPTNLSECK